MRRKKNPNIKNTNKPRANTEQVGKKKTTSQQVLLPVANGDKEQINNGHNKNKLKQKILNPMANSLFVRIVKGVGEEGSSLRL